MCVCVCLGFTIMEGFKTSSQYYNTTTIDQSVMDRIRSA